MPICTTQEVVARQNKLLYEWHAVSRTALCCRGTLARFINSSCAPNCEAQKWHDAATGEIRVGIFAAQDIDPEVELTYDYMFQHAGTAALAGAYRSVQPSALVLNWRILSNFKLCVWLRALCLG